MIAALTAGLLVGACGGGGGHQATSTSTAAAKSPTTSTTGTRTRSPSASPSVSGTTGHASAAAATTAGSPSATAQPSASAGATASASASASAAATSAAAPVIHEDKRFPQLAADPQLSWIQPGGLTGNDKAATDALHAYYQHYMVYGATLDLAKSDVLAHIGPTLTSDFSQLFASYTRHLTGVLTVTVSSVQAASGIVVIKDCFDQTAMFDKGSDGKPIILHDANDHVSEIWTFGKVKGVWLASASTRTQSCTQVG